MVSSFEGSILISCLLMTCIKNIVSLTWNSYLRRLTASLCSTHCCGAFLTIAWCSASVSPPWMRISSSYQIYPSIPFKIVFNISWNDAGVLVKPNGITVYSKSPCLVWKAIFHSSPAAILIRFYLFFRSNLVNHFSALVLSSNSRMSCRGYLLGIVSQFRAL